jgi:menaquinone-dependent protoporphyrinogen oxidase
MKVLVAVASRHGATTEIAKRLRADLRDALTENGSAVDVDLLPVGAVRSLAGYDAAVVGSAVYLGHWIRPARRFLRANAVELRQRPVWLFSSGPVGDLSPAAQVIDLGDLTALFGAREHHVFAGRLDRSSLGVAERIAVAAAGVAEGDFRDWADVTSWAHRIAADLLRSPAPAS